MKTVLELEKQITALSQSLDQTINAHLANFPERVINFEESEIELTVDVHPFTAGVPKQIIAKFISEEGICYSDKDNNDALLKWEDVNGFLEKLNIIENIEELLELV